MLYVVDSEDGRSDEEFVLVLQGDTHALSVLLTRLKLCACLIIFKVVMSMHEEISVEEVAEEVFS